jgi:hypothetical protein
LVFFAAACGDSGSAANAGGGVDDVGQAPGFDQDVQTSQDVREDDTGGFDKPDIDEPEPDTTEPEPDTDEPEPDVPAAEVGELQFLQETGDDGNSCVDASVCLVEVNFNGDRTVAVRYVREGEPVSNALLRFQLSGDGTDEILSVSPNAAYTDPNGEAASLITVENNVPGEYDLVVVVDDDEDVKPIRFKVVVTSKLGAPLIVKFKKEYPDPTPFQTIATTIYKKTAAKPYACSSIELLAKLPAGGVGLPPQNSVNSSIEVPALSGLEDELTQSYTVVALGKTSSGAIRVAGCNDTEGNVQWGQSTTVTVPLYPTPPDYTGCYNVTTNLDLTSALPPQIKSILDIIFALFESPAGGLALLACALGDQVSVLDDLCGYVFNNPDDPEIGEWAGTWANVIIQVVDGLILSLIESEPLAEDIFYTGKDISSILTGLELRSQISMVPLAGSGLTVAIPDANGFFQASQCKQVWSEVRFKWTLGAECDPGDESCGWINLNFNAFTNATIAQANFEARVDPTFYDMNVFPHSVNFQYGKLLNAILKTYLLPAIFGDGSDGLPKIDTYEEALKTFMCGKSGLLPGNDCCEIFAQNIAGQGGGVIADTVELACDALVPLGAGYVEGLLLDLDVDADNLVLETASACKLEDSDGDGKIDSWGTKVNPCQWKLGLDLFGLEANFDADFYALKSPCD